MHACSAAWAGRGRALSPAALSQATTRHLRFCRICLLPASDRYLSTFQKTISIISNKKNNNNRNYANFNEAHVFHTKKISCLVTRHRRAKNLMPCHLGPIDRLIGRYTPINVDDDISKHIKKY